MKRALFVGMSASIFVSVIIIFSITQVEVFVTDVTMHPCQSAALDYVKSYDKSTIQGSISGENDMLEHMVNNLDCYDMQSNEPKGDWYTSEFKIQLKEELVKMVT